MFHESNGRYLRQSPEIRKEDRIEALVIIDEQLVSMTASDLQVSDKDTFLVTAMASLPASFVSRRAALSQSQQGILGITSGMAWDDIAGKLYISRLNEVFTLPRLPVSMDNISCSFVPFFNKPHHFFFRKIALQGQHLLGTISNYDLGMVDMFDKETGQLLKTFKDSEPQRRLRSENNNLLRMRCKTDIEACGIAVHGEHLYVSTEGFIVGFTMNTGRLLPLFTRGNPSMPLLPSPTDGGSKTYRNHHDLCISGDCLFAIHACRVTVYE